MKLGTSHNALKQKRRPVESILVIAIILISIAGIGYISVQQGQWTTVVYQTSGMTVEIGEWLYGEFTGLEHPDNILLSVGCVGEIIGGGAGSVRFNFNHREMTLNEFLQLNDTELEDTFGRSWAENFGGSGTFDSGWGGPIHEQQYVWVLRFLEVYGITEGSIEISFQVIIRPL